MKTEAEITVMCPQAKDNQEVSTVPRNLKERPGMDFPRPPERRDPTDTLISDFHPPEMYMCTKSLQSYSTVRPHGL